MRATDYLMEARSWIGNGFPPVDFQMHTCWTDGRSTVSDMMHAAKQRSMTAIAITEHVNSTSSYYADFREEVVELRKRIGCLDVFYGIEVSISDYDGGLRTKLRRPVDTELVLGVVHSYPKDGGGFHRFGDLTPDQALSCELRGLSSLATNPDIDVIGHPGGTYFKRFGPFPVRRMERAFRMAADHGIAIEVNTAYCWDIDGFLELVEAVNPRLSFGSDAHVADDVGSNCDFLQDWEQSRRDRGAA